MDSYSFPEFSLWLCKLEHLSQHFMMGGESLEVEKIQDGRETRFLHYAFSFVRRNSILIFSSFFRKKNQGNANCAHVSRVNRRLFKREAKANGPIKHI